MNQTRTAPGRRMLREWLLHPLRDAALLEARLDAVEAFVSAFDLREGVRKSLYRIHDLERLASRLAAGRANARDLVALARSLERVPEIKEAIRGVAPLSALYERIQPLEGVREAIRAALVEDPPTKLTEGGLIKDGYDAELDAFRRQAEEARAWIAALEGRLREEAGIPTLKVGYNAVFGYYLEVTRPYYDRVPADWRPIQTLKDRQRYTRPDLKEKEREILRAEEAAKRRELLVFQELREEVAKSFEAVRELALALAELDVYAALAELAVESGYTRPRFTEGALSIEEGRHPVVEKSRSFVPNDLEMGESLRTLVLTGPNMSGKSTYLRQIALIALMAQVGSFVPARRAELPLFDRIFTRIGAADDIAGGRSTFMVEMEELAEILSGASEKSLTRWEGGPRARTGSRSPGPAWSDSPRSAPIPFLPPTTSSSPSSPSGCRGRRTSTWPPGRSRAGWSFTTRCCRGRRRSRTASRSPAWPAFPLRWSPAPRRCWRGPWRRARGPRAS